ncbi:MAG: fibronectin type III domain-containing protein, partial [Phaeodactylibacter sp.]|nr:fibronectin type III domain-containing protein [Phaeodactylibacter sp.]
MHRLPFALILCVGFALNISAQPLECSADPTSEQNDFMTGNNPHDAGFSLYPPGTAPHQIPVVCYVVRNFDGSLSASPASVEQAVMEANSIFGGAFIEFYLVSDVVIIEDFNLYLTERSNIYQHNAYPYLPNAINLYFTGDIINSSGNSISNGFATFPQSVDIDLSTFGIDRVFIKGTSSNFFTTLKHELGHYFGLYHTFQETVCGCFGTYDNASNTYNCSDVDVNSDPWTTGDKCADTPVDPGMGALAYPNLLYYSNTCQYVDFSLNPFSLDDFFNEDCFASNPFPVSGVALRDQNGLPFAPDPTNLMSYCSSCRENFSQDQYERILYYLLNGRQYLLNPVSEEISVLSPQLTNLTGGEQAYITWFSQQNTAFDIFLKIDGQIMETIQTGFQGPGNSNGFYYFPWTVSNYLTANAQIEIQFSNNPGIKDVGLPFSIAGTGTNNCDFDGICDTGENCLTCSDCGPCPSLTLTWPAGPNQCLEPGSQQLITWTSTGSITAVNIAYCKVGGACYSIAPSTANDGAAPWTVNGSNGTGDYFIRITDTSDPSVTDDGPVFQISDDCTPPTCGDGNCDPGEDCQSCPQDCGPCPPAQAYLQLSSGCVVYAATVCLGTQPSVLANIYNPTSVEWRGRVRFLWQQVGNPNNIFEFIFGNPSYTIAPGQAKQIPATLNTNVVGPGSYILTISESNYDGGFQPWELVYDGPSCINYFSQAIQDCAGPQCTIPAITDIATNCDGVGNYSISASFTGGTNELYNLYTQAGNDILYTVSNVSPGQDIFLGNNYLESYQVFVHVEQAGNPGSCFDVEAVPPTDCAIDEYLIVTPQADCHEQGEIITAEWNVPQGLYTLHFCETGNTCVQIYPTYYTGSNDFSLTIPNISGDFYFELRDFYDNIYLQSPVFEISSDCTPTPVCSTVVTNINDSGPGSLREAINCANNNPGPDVITFNIPGNGPHTIQVSSDILTITDAYTVIDGATQPGYINGGIIIEGANAVNTGLSVLADNTEIYGLYIRNFSSTAISVYDVKNCLIGSVSKPNYFTNGFYGIFLGRGPLSYGNEFVGNYIGLSPQGTGEGNNYGINIFGSQNNLFQQNTIAHNSIAVFFNGGSNTGNKFFQNSFYCNPNAITGTTVQNSAPLIANASLAQISGTAGAGQIIEIFRQSNAACSQVCQGKDFLGTTASDNNGNWTLAAPFYFSLNEGDIITALATEAVSGTSRFSNCMAIPINCPSPAGLGASSITSSSAVLDWSDVPGANSYELEWWPVGGVHNTQFTSQSVFALSNLAPGTDYCFKVRSLCSGGSGDFSSQACFMTEQNNACSTLVTNTNDSGAGSLREAINCANANPGPDLITFNIPGSGPFVIQLAPGSQLPTLTDGNTTIDASTQPNYTPGLIELVSPSQNFGNGFTIEADNCHIYGLRIRGFGTGVRMSQNSGSPRTVYVGAPGKGNIFYKNGQGVGLYGSIPVAVVKSNEFYGDFALNFTGIHLQSNNNIVGGADPSEGNIIHHLWRGVAYASSANLNISVLKNQFYCNTTPIYIFQSSTATATPLITVASATTISGTAVPNALVEVFYADQTCSSAPCQGRDFIAETIANGTGSWSVQGSFVGGNTITATAKSGNLHTSGFASCQVIEIVTTLGCTNPAAHNYNPAANLEDGSCETCDDGIQNGDETGIDCGGALCAPCACDNLAVWNMGPAGTAPVYSATFVAPNVSAGIITIGPGAVRLGYLNFGNPPASFSIQQVNSPSFDTQDYFEISLSSAQGGLAMTNLSIDMQSNGAGPSNWQVRSSLDNYTTVIASGNFTSRDVWETKSINLSAIGSALSAVTFRVYAYGATDYTFGRWYIDNIIVCGEVDNCLTSWYFDGDGDSFGNPDISMLSCTQPDNYVPDNTDCDDTNPAVHPNATEVCDGIDNNCNTYVDLDDPELVDNTPPIAACQDNTLTFNGEQSVPLLALDVWDELASQDNCGVLHFTGVDPISITCDQIGMLIPATVTIEDGSGNTSTCQSMITVEGLPCGISAPEEGIDCPEGVVEYNVDTETYTLTAPCANNSLDNDAMAFAGGQECGDFVITVKIESVTPNGYAGLVARESDASGSKMVGIFSNLSPLLRWEART